MTSSGDKLPELITLSSNPKGLVGGAGAGADADADAVVDAVQEI